MADTSKGVEVGGYRIELEVEGDPDRGWSASIGAAAQTAAGRRRLFSPADLEGFRRVVRASGETPAAARAELVAWLRRQARDAATKRTAARLAKRRADYARRRDAGPGRRST